MTHPRRKPLDYIKDMLGFCSRIQQYTAGKSSEDFLADSMLQDALVRNIELLGEASKQLLEVLPTAPVRFPSIPFDVMYATRNRLIHGYSDLRLLTIWQVADHEIPALRSDLEPPSPHGPTTSNSPSQSLHPTKATNFVRP